jgi:peptidoglycan-associated lipoprotein
MAGAGSGATGAAGDASQPAVDGGATATAATGSGSSSTGGSGLPAGPPTGTTLPLLPSPAEFVEAKELGDVHFEFDRADIRPADRTVLDGNVAWLRANVRVLVLVEGHCDERGTNEYNLALGERRAKAIRDYLTSVGVDAARVTVISYGKERPLCNDANEGCWGSNRRAHFLVKQ